jgi:hypothetical protein
VLYIQKEKLDLWTTIPKQYTVTVLIEDSALRYTSWFRAGLQQRKYHILLNHFRTYGGIREGESKGEGEQPIDSIRTKTVPNYSSTNWLSQRANKAPNNTEGHKAKKTRNTQAISGSPVNGRSSDISTKVRNSLQSPSTDGRRLSCSSSSHDTQCGGARQTSRESSTTK